MNKLMYTLLLPASLAFSTSALTQAQEKPALSFKTTEVGSGLYMLEGVNGFTGGNLGLSVGADGVVLIDDSMPPVLDIMQAAIKEITTRPVDFLINTHVHGDHTGNNAHYGEAGAHIVAHENLRQHLVDKGVQTAEGMAPAPAAALPVITFSKAMSFHLNGDQAEVFHVARAHTDGDAVIHFHDANVIHTGDAFFNGLFPFIDLDSGGSVSGYIAAQKDILERANDATQIIPGHGPLASKADLQAAVDMLTDARNRVQVHLSAGKTEAEILAENPLAKYHDDWNWGFITTERMTKTLIRDLSGEPHAEDHSH